MLPVSATSAVATSGTIPRGVPYFARARRQRCVLSHGLWTNVIDYDAVTQLTQVRQPSDVGFPEQTIARGSYFPMCGMNLAWRPELTPAMYFLLMGKDWGVDRFGDRTTPQGIDLLPQGLQKDPQVGDAPDDAHGQRTYLFKAGGTRASLQEPPVRLGRHWATWERTASASV